MNINFLTSSRSIPRSIAILLIVLIQLPAISLASDFRGPLHSHRSISPATTEVNRTSSLLTTFSNTTSLTIADRAGSALPPGVASLYPSPITVSGLSGTITDVNITLTGITASRPRDLDVLLVAPTGQTLVVMADTGNLCSISNVNVTLDDQAAAQLPDPTNGCPPDPAITTGSYKPTNIVFGTEVDTFPSPAPASPYNQAAPTGTSTLASIFNGLSPNGTWNLYVVDDSLGGGSSTISGGWSIDITTAGAVSATTTVVNSNLNPALTTQSITFTSTTTITSGGLPATSGTVSFSNNGNAIAGCTSVAVNGSGVATCTTTLAEGTRTIAANYSGTATLGASSGTVSQVVNSPTVVVGAQFCNNGGFTITDAGTSAPIYPSNITVSGLSGTISTVTAQVNGLTAARSDNIDLLLVGSGGQAFKLLSDAGDAVTPVSVNLTLSDAGAALLPQGSAISSGTFKPTDYNVTVDTFPAPAPASINAPAPTGSATFASVYSATNPNGTWSMYAVDDGIGGGSSSVSGWCVNFTLTPFATTTTVASSQNPSLVGQSVTFTATVTSSGGTPTGTVQFMDGATPIGSAVGLDGTGHASVSTSSLTAGSHTITAQYSGATIGAGGGGFASGSGSLSGGQTVNSTATWNGSASNDWNNPANWSTNFVPGSTLNIDIPAAGVTNDPAINTVDVTAVNITIGGTHTITIASGRTLNATGTVALGGGQIVGLGTLSLGTAATITRTTGQVNTTLNKAFSGAGPLFQYPVGTAGQFSPVDVTVTAGSGNLSIKANSGTAPATPAFDSTKMLQRYWTLNGSGITSNVTFHYLDADIPVTSTESAYSIFRVLSGGTALRFNPDGTNVILNAAANTFTVNSLSNYSNWTAGNPLAPTAADVSISGRILDSQGRGIAGARVTIQDQQGQTNGAVSNPFGFYRIDGVRTGASYVVTVQHKLFEFQPRVITVTDELTEVNFIALSTSAPSNIKKSESSVPIRKRP
jgi:hypothetical protein